jgi:outer membrane protein assembly factor BamB
MPLFTSTERVALAVGKLSYEDYYYLLDGQMYIISADSGKLLWNTDLVDLTGHNDIPLPAVNESEDHIYLAVDGMVGAFEGNTGKIIWQHAHLLATNNLILQENDLIISGPIFIGMMDRISGKLHCKQIGTELGKFIGMDNRGLYYVKYHMEPQKFLWWELHKWTYKSDLYIVEQSTCRLHLQATLNDNLVAYDPATGEGLVVVGDLDNPIILRQTMVPLP